MIASRGLPPLKSGELALNKGELVDNARGADGHNELMEVQSRDLDGMGRRLWWVVDSSKERDERRLDESGYGGRILHVG